MAIISDPKHLTIPAFGAAYNVGRTKTYELINSGQLPARKIGARTVIAIEDAEEWRKSLPIYVKPFVESSRHTRSTQLVDRTGRCDRSATAQNTLDVAPPVYGKKALSTRRSSKRAQAASTRKY